MEIRRDDGSGAMPNEVGEMIVCSRYLSPGYWKRPDLDAAAFSADPREPGSRRYASGDFGHIDESGNLHFLGRKGGRIKIRGHSVDLMEIEAALATCPGVTKAAALAFGGELTAEPVRLVAYVATSDASDRDALVMRRLPREPIAILHAAVEDRISGRTAADVERQDRSQGAWLRIDASSPDDAAADRGGAGRSGASVLQASSSNCSSWRPSGGAMTSICSAAIHCWAWSCRRVCARASGCTSGISTRTRRSRELQPTCGTSTLRHRPNRARSRC